MSDLPPFVFDICRCPACKRQATYETGARYCRYCGAILHLPTFRREQANRKIKEQFK